MRLRIAAVRIAVFSLLFLIPNLDIVSPAQADSFGRAKGNGIRLKRHKVMDTNGTGKLAGTYLLPDGYSARDVIKWIPNDYLTPVVGITTLTSTDGEVVLESMSGIEINYGHSPAGSNGVDPPQSVCAFLMNAWKDQHPDLNATVVSSKDTEIPEATQNGGGFRAYANRGVFKLKYTKNGVSYLVKCSARIDVMGTTPTPTAIGGVIYEGGWVISNGYSVTAPESKISSAMKLFGIVLASYRVDPHFFNTVMQAREIIQANFYAQQRQIMETSRIISQTNEAISATINSAYKTSQAASDREAQNFDDSIRGIDRYQEPDGVVSLPSGYAHAWSDGTGGYLVTDEALFNPNVNGPHGTWHEMERH